MHHALFRTRRLQRAHHCHSSSASTEHAANTRNTQTTTICRHHRKVRVATTTFQLLPVFLLLGWASFWGQKMGRFMGPSERKPEQRAQRGGAENGPFLGTAKNAITHVAVAAPRPRPGHDCLALGRASAGHMSATEAVAPHEYGRDGHPDVHGRPVGETCPRGGKQPRACSHKVANQSGA